MDLKTYFQDNKGTGVLATSNAEGPVNAAVYATPHVMEDGTVAFIMPDKLTHANLQSNPHAAYLFKEAERKDRKHDGVRLYLKKVREEKDTDLLYSLRRRKYEEDQKARYLVFFEILKQLPLIGTGDQ